MRKIAILGAGESGVGAALLAKKLGLEIWVSDLGEIKSKFKSELDSHDIPYEEGKHSEGIILSAHLIIKSPGIPEKVALIQKAIANEIPVISEIEFAAGYTDAKILGITGSNGKTTTTEFAYHVFKTAGLNVAVGGNIGTSFARLVAEGNTDYYVLELSSFQLDGIRSFRPNISILLNITPDHLDRYDYSFEKYIASKFRIAMNQGNEDLLIYNAKDKATLNYLEEHELKSDRFGVLTIIEGQKLKVGASTFDVSKTSLKGTHNMFNASCAIYAAKKWKVEDEQIQEALDSFVIVPHRLEQVAEVNGVEFINDSKATNIDAVYWALEAMRKPTIWIVGGVDKGNDYSVLSELVREKVRGIVCLGVDNKKILDFFKDYRIPIEEADSAKKAVKKAMKMARKGEGVLLSPACASFDLFKNYIDRGDQFKAHVLKLVEK